MVDKFKLAKRKSQRRAEYARTSETANTKIANSEEIVEAVHKKRAKKLLFDANIENWNPRTELGKKVKEGEIKSLDEIFIKNMKIIEPEIVDFFIKDINEKLMDTTKTSYVRMSGRKYNYRCAVLIGDGNKYLGFAVAKDKDRWTAAGKAARLARLNLVQIKKGCGSWECRCSNLHSIPFEVDGKTGASRITIRPAPLGVGLVVSEYIKPVFQFVNIQDVWSRGSGETATKINIIKATIEALKKTNTKVNYR